MSEELDRLRRENEQLKRMLAGAPEEKEPSPEDPYIASARALLHQRVRVLRGEHAGREGDVDCASRSGDAWVHFDGELTPEFVDVPVTGDDGKPTGETTKVRCESHGARITHVFRHEDLELVA